MPRASRLSVRLSDDERTAFSAAAVAAGYAPAAWLRRIAVASLATPELVAPSPGPNQEPPPAAALIRPVATRLTAEQYAELEHRARASGLPVAAFVRLAILGTKPPELTHRGDVRPAIAQLGRVGNNLNQLTRLANNGTLFPADLAATLDAVHAAVRDVRDALIREDER
jgi:hypothetical protein